MTISLIAALGSNKVIGANGDLPWHLPNDLKFFSATTRGHYVIMGRKNFDSIPDKYRPLPHRPNVVVTRNERFSAENVEVFHSIKSAIDFAREQGEEEAFIIGGGEIYKQSLALANKMYLTHVEAAPSGDTHFPEFDMNDWKRTLLLDQRVDAVHKHAFKTYEYTRLL